MLRWTTWDEAVVSFDETWRMRKSQSCKNEVWCKGARIQAKDLENSVSEVRKDETKRGWNYHGVRVDRDQDKIRQGQVGQEKEFESSSKMGVTDSFPTGKWYGFTSVGKNISLVVMKKMKHSEVNVKDQLGSYRKCLDEIWLFLKIWL